MIRGVIRWLRVAAPPRWAGLLLLPIVANEAAYVWAVWKGAVPAFAEPLLKPRDVFLLLAAAILGFARVHVFHPLYHQGYRSWLKLTPWTSRVPLPVGPLHLVPQDALWLLLAFLLWHDPQYSRLYLPLCFLLGYLVAIFPSCWATGLGAMGYLLAFGVGEVLRQWYNPLAAICIAGWLYLAAWLAVRQMLARFPWEIPWYWEQRSLQAIADETKQRMLGWPLDQLHGRIGDARVDYISGTLVSFLFGWWSYCLLSLITNPLTAGGFRQMVLGLTAMMGIFVRTFGYWVDYRPPISFWGRLWTLRWIIPRYDHIWVTPILIYIAAWYVPGVLIAWRVPSDIAMTAATTLVALLAFNMPPSFERWRLTGFHRVVPGSINKQEFLKI